MLEVLQDRLGVVGGGVGRGSKPNKDKLSTGAKQLTKKERDRLTGRKYMNTFQQSNQSHTNKHTKDWQKV